MTYDGATGRPYHHGDLPAALRAATVELVRERGPMGFSLREVARRAGVSHGAPAHHFGGSRGLLTSVAAEGFRKLADSLVQASNGVSDARQRLRRTGLAYVHTAESYPGHFGVIFQKELVEDSDLICSAESGRAYRELMDTVKAVRDQLNPELDIEVAAIMCWATMQGLLVVAPTVDHMRRNTGSNGWSLDDMVERIADLLIAGFEAR